MRFRALALLGGVSAIAISSAAAAQDSQSPLGTFLGTITLIFGGQENIEATGGAVVTEEDIEKLAPANLSELFARESAVTVSAGGGVAKRVSVFGMEQSLLAVTVDGVAQVATSWHHTGSHAVDPAFLKSVEVEAGAAAADAGFGAAAGALRYETVDAQDLLEDGQIVGGRASLSWGSNGQGVSGTLAGFGRHQGLDWLVILHGADGKDYKNGDGEVTKGTAPAVRSAVAKVGYEFEDHRIELSFSHSVDDADRLVKANMDLAPPREPGLNPLKVTDTSVKLSYTSTNPTDLWDPEFSIYLNQYEYWRNNYTTNGAFRTNGNMILDEDLFGGKFQNTFTLPAGKVTAGLDFGMHDYSIDNYGNNDRRYRDFSSDQIGLFAQGRFEFDSGFRLSTGMRYDVHRFTDWDGNRFTDSGASLNGTLSYRFNDNVEVFAGASRTWLGYVIGDYAYLHARTSSFYTDPDLQPGEAQNLKIGANFGGDNWKAGITFFDTRLENALTYSGTDGGGVTFLTNEDAEYRSKGFTLNASLDLGATTVGATYTKADVTEDGQTVIPANGYYFMPVGKMATLYVDHAIPAYNLKLGATVEWAGSTPEIVDGSTTYHALKSYAVVNAYGEWSPQGYDNLTVRLGVDNLFDETYVERSSYVSSTTADSIYGPGRTITLGVGMKF